MVNGWKVTALIFLTLFILENMFWGWAIWYGMQEETKINECYYEVCSEYPEAWYDENICYCYGYDMLGNEIIEHTEVMR